MKCKNFIPLIPYIRKKDVHKIFVHYYGQHVEYDEMKIVSTYDRPDLVELLYRKGFKIELEFYTSFSVYQTLHRLGYTFTNEHLLYAINSNSVSVTKLLVSLGLVITTEETKYVFREHGYDKTDIIDYLIDINAPLSTDMLFDSDNNMEYFSYYMKKLYGVEAYIRDNIAVVNGIKIKIHRGMLINDSFKLLV
jgi:hypothetical protein